MGPVANEVLTVWGKRHLAEGAVDRNTDASSFAGIQAVAKDRPLAFVRPIRDRVIVSVHQFEKGGSSMTRTTRTHHRSVAIDIIKGMAIVGVVTNHSISKSTFHAIGGQFDTGQSVTFFLVVMGLNVAASVRRREGASLRDLYTFDYLIGRADRILTPFFIAYIGALVLVLSAHLNHPGFALLWGDLFTGVLPINGPGSYFMPLLFQLVLILPFVFWAMGRWPRATLLVCLLLNIGFDTLASHLSFFTAFPFASTSFAMRFIFIVALGGFCAAWPPMRTLRSPWMWVGVPLSIVYLVLAEIDPDMLNSTHLSTVAGPVLIAVWGTFVILLGLVLLRGVNRGPVVRLGTMLGRASFHIYLVQIAWFGIGLWAAHSALEVLGNLIAALTAGVAFYTLMEWTPLPSFAGLHRGLVVLRWGVDQRRE
jgi:peptidoglycan/LPS O-acetylase OafA/YrhL